MVDHYNASCNTSISPHLRQYQWFEVISFCHHSFYRFNHISHYQYIINNIITLNSITINLRLYIITSSLLLYMFCLSLMNSTVPFSLLYTYLIKANCTTALVTWRKWTQVSNIHFMKWMPPPHHHQRLRQSRYAFGRWVTIWNLGCWGKRAI